MKSDLIVLVIIIRELNFLNITQIRAILMDGTVENADCTYA